MLMMPLPRQATQEVMKLLAMVNYTSHVQQVPAVTPSPHSPQIRAGARLASLGPADRTVLVPIHV